MRVLVFAKGDKEKEALDAGADHVGGEDLAKKIQDEGWFDFDRVVAAPDMMGVVGKAWVAYWGLGVDAQSEAGNRDSERRSGHRRSRRQARSSTEWISRASCTARLGKASLEAQQLLGECLGVD